jgi:hypothetical protein
MHHVAATSTVLTPKPLYDVGDEYSSEEEEQEAEPTPYIAAQAAVTPPTAAFSASSVDKLNARIAHMQLVEQQQEGESHTLQGGWSWMALLTDAAADCHRCVHCHTWACVAGTDAAWCMSACLHPCLM